MSGEISPEVPEAPPTPVGGNPARVCRVVINCDRCGRTCRDAHDLRKHLGRKRPCQSVPGDLSGPCPHCGKNDFGPGAVPGSVAWAEELTEHCRRRCYGGASRTPRGRPTTLLAPLAIAGGTEVTELRATIDALQIEVTRLTATCAALEGANRNAESRITALEREKS